MVRACPGHWQTVLRVSMLTTGMLRRSSNGIQVSRRISVHFWRSQLSLDGPLLSAIFPKKLSSA